MQTDAWVVFLDIYGFSAMMKNEMYKQLHDRILEGNNQLQTVLKKRGDEVMFFSFSDSIFLIYKVSDQKLKGRIARRCIADVKSIMGKFFTLSLPLRGSMAFGEIYYSNKYFLGQPVVSAYHYEQLVPAPFFFIPLKELRDTEHVEKNLGLDHVVILKDGTPMFGKIFHPFPLEKFIKIVRKNFQIYLMDGPSSPAKAWYEAMKYIEDLLRKKKGE